MLGELGGRGAILEQCLCKVMFRPNSREHVQVIGMSATLGNPSEVCRFLGANLFRTNFRPVALVERIKVHDKLYRLDEEGNWRVEKELGGAGTNKVSGVIREQKFIYGTENRKEGSGWTGHLAGQPDQGIRADLLSDQTEL